MGVLIALEKDGDGMQAGVCSLYLTLTLRGGDDDTNNLLVKQLCVRSTPI